MMSNDALPLPDSADGVLRRDLEAGLTSAIEG